jgi:hypothetical protein
MKIEECAIRFEEERENDDLENLKRERDTRSSLAKRDTRLY